MQIPPSRHAFEILWYKTKRKGPRIPGFLLLPGYFIKWHLIHDEFKIPSKKAAPPRDGPVLNFWL